MTVAGSLRIGLNMQPVEGGHDGVTPTAAEVLDVARLAEEVGFDSLWVPDHLQHFEQEIVEHFDLPVPEPWRELPMMGWWEPWTMLTGVAMATRKVAVGPLVACTGYRNPALLAKMADTLDALSGGRVILGLGAGDALAEFHAFGYPTDHRVDRFEEAVTIISGILKDGRSDFEGRYEQARGVERRPPGPRPGGPPLMISAKGPRMLRLCARFGDAWNGWLGYGRSEPASAAPLMRALDEACNAIGRDPRSLERTVAVCVAVLGRRPPVEAPITGSAEEIAARLLEFRDAGFAHVQVVIEPFSVAGVEAFAPVLEQLASA